MNSRETRGAGRREICTRGRKLDASQTILSPPRSPSIKFTFHKIIRAARSTMAQMPTDPDTEFPQDFDSAHITYQPKPVRDEKYICMLKSCIKSITDETRKAQTEGCDSVLFTVTPEGGACRALGSTSLQEFYAEDCRNMDKPEHMWEKMQWDQLVADVGQKLADRFGCNVRMLLETGTGGHAFHTVAECGAATAMFQIIFM